MMTRGVRYSCNDASDGSGRLAVRVSVSHESTTAGYSVHGPNAEMAMEDGARVIQRDNPDLRHRARFFMLMTLMLICGGVNFLEISQ